MALFNHNPPNGQSLLSALFVDRDAERRKLAERIPGDLDADAIVAIHGPSRVGKSHLMLRFLQDIDSAHHHVFIIKAAGGRTARQILTELYERVRTRLLSIEEPVDLEPEEVSSRGILDEARALVRIFDGLVTGAESSRVISYSSAFEQSGAFKILAQLMGLSAELGGGAKGTETRTHTVTLAVPSDQRLVDFVRELCEILWEATRKSAIIYIDDVDLLELGTPAAPVAQKQESEQTTVLLRLLHCLAGCPHIAVAASLRTRHFTIGHKELTEGVRVRPLSDSDITGVYRKQLEQFRKGQPVFDDDSLAELVGAAGGRVGNFLRLCSKFLDWGDLNGRTEAGRLLQVADLEDFFLEEIRDLSRDPELSGHVERILAAAQQTPPQLRVTLDPEVLRTQLVYTLLEEPDSGSAKVYRIIELVARVLRKHRIEPDRDREPAEKT